MPVSWIEKENDWFLLVNFPENAFFMEKSDFVVLSVQKCRGKMVKMRRSLLQHNSFLRKHCKDLEE